MPLKIVTADQRLQEAKNKTTFCIVGPAGVGKTALLHTLDPRTTLAVDIEGGFKSVQTWLGDVILIRSYEDAENLACLIGGASPAVQDQTQPFSRAHYDYVMREFGSALDISRYENIFTDSITDLTRLGMIDARYKTPLGKNGAEDTRGAYGKMGRDVITLLKHMQHAPVRNVIFVGLLQEEKDELGRVTWEMQMEGSKVGREIPGIIDQLITMSRFDFDEKDGWNHNPTGGPFRAFVCQQPNPWGLPAKDRAGACKLIEKPHLGELIENINRPAKDMLSKMNYELGDKK